jgi:hypothetical protein
VLVVVADGRQQLRDVVVVQRVAGVAPLAMSANQPQAAQYAQVVRRRARTQAAGGRQLLDRPPSGRSVIHRRNWCWLS